MPFSLPSPQLLLLLLLPLILVPARTWLHHNIKRLVAHGKRPFPIHLRTQGTTLRSTLDMCVVPTPLSEQGKGQVFVRAWPSSDLRTGWYRDSYEDLFAFLRASYPQFLVVNLVPRSQVAYGPGKTYGGRLANFPTPDHEPPSLALLLLVAHALHAFLSAPLRENSEPRLADEEHLGPSKAVVIHCKGGKSRAGAFACALYLLAHHRLTPFRSMEEAHRMAQEAIQHFTAARFLSPTEPEFVSMPCLSLIFGLGRALGLVKDKRRTMGIRSPAQRQMIAYFAEYLHYQHRHLEPSLLMHHDGAPSLRLTCVTVTVDAAKLSEQRLVLELKRYDPARCLKYQQMLARFEATAELSSDHSDVRPEKIIAETASKLRVDADDDDESAQLQTFYRFGQAMPPLEYSGKEIRFSPMVTFDPRQEIHLSIRCGKSCISTPFNSRLELLRHTPSFSFDLPLATFRIAGGKDSVAVQAINIQLEVM